MAATAPSLGPELSVSFENRALLAAVPKQELFRFRFGKDLTEPGADNTFRLHIDSVDELVTDEIWHTRGEVTTGRSDGFAWAECDRHLAVHIELATDSINNFREMSTDAYCRLLSFVQQRGYPNLVRTWNFFPQINDGDGDYERYKLFTVGRAIAFEKFDYSDNMLPAATAIGTDTGTPFTISMIATREDCRMVENPRQISAYNYPRDYGPRGPSFSRAVTIPSHDGYRILISGTASIVGHESCHDDNPERQVLETVQNLEDLVQHAKIVADAKLADRDIYDCCLRVYIRSKEQALDIKRALRQRFNGDHQLLFLRGDICRSELLVEVEAACRI